MAGDEQGQGQGQGWLSAEETEIEQRAAVVQGISWRPMAKLKVVSVLIPSSIFAKAVAAFIDNAPADIKYLLGALRRSRAETAAMQKALQVDPETVGRIMHESWTATKRAQGFHGPNEPHEWQIVKHPHLGDMTLNCPSLERYFGVKQTCAKFHADLIPWEELPEAQKGINRHAFDAVLAWMRARVVQVQEANGDGNGRD